MADHNIPFEIQEEIVKRLPVKSLLRFRSVSKPWKSFINSSKFIRDHHVIRHTESQHHLLLIYKKFYNLKYVSIVDDYTFPLQKLSVTIPMAVKLLHPQPRIVGSSQGLVCLYSYANNGTKTRAVIWNPTIHKSVAIDVVSKVLYDDDIDETLRTIVGFGVSPETLDPMLVKITNHFEINPRQVEIYTLSSGVWRCPRGNMPRESTNITQPSINIDTFIYWLAYGDRAPFIVALDMTSEEFSEVDLTISLTSRSGDLDIFKLRGSLVVLESNFHVWMMKNGNPKTFTHIFNINHTCIGRVLGFRKSGEHAVEIRKDGNNAELFACEPNSQHISPIWITGEVYSFFASSYMETLLLLDH